MSQLQSFRPNPKKPRSGGMVAQTLVEFALTLLVFLLTLTMIIEIARILQAFITVQHAARMAGRFAVTGRFYDYYNDMSGALDTTQEDNGNISGASVSLDPFTGDVTGVSGGNGPGWNATSDVALQRILPCRPIMHTTQDGRQDPLVNFYPFGATWTEGADWDHRLHTMYQAQATYISAYPYYQPFRNARTCSVEEVAVRAMTGIPLDPNAPGEFHPETGQRYGGYYSVQVRSVPTDSSPQNSSDVFDRSNSRGGNAQNDVAVNAYYGDPAFAGEQGGICLDNATNSWSTISGVDSQTARANCEALSSDHEYFDTNDALVSGFAGAPSEPVVIQIEYNLPIITPLIANIAPAILVEGAVVMINEPFGNTGLQQQAQLPPPLPDVQPLSSAPELQLSEIVPEATCYYDDGSGRVRIGYFNRNSISVQDDGDRVTETSSAGSLVAEFQNGRVSNVTEPVLSVGSSFTWQITIDSDEDGIVEWDDTLTVQRTGTNTFTGTLLSDGTENAPASTDILTLLDCATVDSFGSGVGGPVSGTISFEPGQATLIRPGNTGSVAAIETTGSFEWTEVADAEWYYVWVGYFDSSGYPSGNLIEEGNDYMQVGVDITCDDDDGDTVVTCRGVPNIGLAVGREYAWYVRPYTSGDPGWQDAAGLGPWSFPRFFELTQSPLVPAELRSPIDGESVGVNPPTFQWIQKDNVTQAFIYLVSQNSGVVYRELYDADDICSSTAPANDGSGNSVTLAANEDWCELTPTFSVPLQTGNYVWWVRVSNPQDPNGVWTEDPENFELTVAPPLPTVPAAPTLVSPVSPTVLTTETAARPDFVFNSVPSALEYAVYLEDSTGTELYFQWFEAADICSGGVCTVSYPFSNALANDIYTWNARAWNVIDFGPWSAAGNFGVSVLPDGAPIGTTTLQYPLGGITIDDAEAIAQGATSKEQPVFRWSKYAAAGAEEAPTSYRLYIQDKFDSTDVEFDQVIPLASLSDQGSYWEYQLPTPLDATNGNEFQWFVRPINSVSFGNYSGPGEFAVDVPNACFAGVSYDFNTGNEGWTYGDNPFAFGDSRGNGGPAAQATFIGNPAVDPDVGAVAGNALGIQLGANASNMQGGYAVTVTLSQPIDGRLSFDYRVVMHPSYEDNEFSQVILEVDNNLIGANGNADFIDEADGNNANDLIDWTRAVVDVGPLSAGSHTIVLGLYNNNSTTGSEVAKVFFDNVTLDDPCVDATATPTPIAPFTTLAYNFDSGSDPDFSYSDNIIGNRSTGSGGNAGAISSAGGDDGLGIGVLLDGDNAQGAFEVEFTLAETRDMRVRFRYRLDVDELEPPPNSDNEWAEVLVEFGATLFVIDDSLGNGNYDSGWQDGSADLGVLSPGTYTLRFGGWLSATDNGSEDASIFFDTIRIEEKP